MDNGSLFWALYSPVISFQVLRTVLRAENVKWLQDDASLWLNVCMQATMERGMVGIWKEAAVA